MGKSGRSKNKQKRSTTTLPKGIPHKRGHKGGPSPFEHARTTNSTSRVKHFVHNRQVGNNGASTNNNNNNGKQGTSAQPQRQSALARSIALRKHHLTTQIANATKSNEFIDRRIGEASRIKGYDGPSREDVMLKRIVQERVRRIKKRNKFSLDDDGDGEEEEMGGLTHRVSNF